LLRLRRACLSLGQRRELLMLFATSCEGEVMMMPIPMPRVGLV
jgi:hypothetical protein